MASRRAKMDRASRAKQFMPFDALKGLRDALREKERILVSRRDVPEEQRDELNERLGRIRKNDMICVEFYQEGEYIRMTGRVSRIDNTAGSVTVIHTNIAFEDISDIQL